MSLLSLILQDSLIKEYQLWKRTGSKKAARQHIEHYGSGKKTIINIDNNNLYFINALEIFLCVLLVQNPKLTEGWVTDT